MAVGKKKEAKHKAKKKQSEACPVKVKLLEGTALKNVDKKPGKNRCPVWVKAEHISYEQELKKLQIELMKLQKHQRIYQKKKKMKVNLLKQKKTLPV